jgi:hypothetical protein
MDAAVRTAFKGNCSKSIIAWGRYAGCGKRQRSSIVPLSLTNDETRALVGPDRR